MAPAMALPHTSTRSFSRPVDAMYTPSTGFHSSLSALDLSSALAWVAVKVAVKQICCVSVDRVTLRCVCV
jgi:hypothetical protein